MSVEKELELPKKKLKNRGTNLNKANGKSFTKENAAEMGRKGAKARIDNFNKKKTLKEAMSLVLELPATGNTKEMLVSLGCNDDEQTNASAIAATLFAMAMRGDTKAMELVLDYGFKVSEDERKTKESDARISAMAKNGVDISVNSGNDDGGVVIYLPALENEEAEQAGSEAE